METKTTTVSKQTGFFVCLWLLRPIIPARPGIRQVRILDQKFFWSQKLSDNLSLLANLFIRGTLINWEYWYELNLNDFLEFQAD